jgi:hypothetical protein
MKLILFISTFLIAITISSCCTKVDCSQGPSKIVKGSTLTLLDSVEIKVFASSTNFSKAIDSIYLCNYINEYRITDFTKDYKVTVLSNNKIYLINEFTKTNQACNECAIGSGTAEEVYTKFKVNGVEQGFSNIEINK